jgi:hypothetical protein
MKIPFLNEAYSKKQEEIILGSYGTEDDLLRKDSSESYRMKSKIQEDDPKQIKKDLD